MSFKENLNKAMKNKNITQQQLLIDILDKLNIDGKYSVAEKYEKEKSNFSNMIANGMSGSRKYKLDYIIPTEQILDIRFADLLDDDVDMKVKYVNKGIRYVASLNDYNATIDLMNEYVGEESVFFNEDEYGKGILEYILEYKSDNCFKAIVDNDLLKIDSFGRIEHFYKFYDLKQQLRIMEYVCEIDDAEMFDNILVANTKFNDPYDDTNRDILVKNEVLYSYILNTKNILNSVLKLKEDAKCCNYQYSSVRKDKCHYFNPLLVGVLYYALKYPDKYDKQLIHILEKTKNYNEIIISDFIDDEANYEVRNGFIIDPRGYRAVGDIIYYELPLIPGTSEKVQNLIHSANAIANKLIYKKNSIPSFNFTKKKYIVVNDMLYKPKSDNKTEYEFYEFTKDLNINAIPRFYGTSDDGVDKLSYITNSSPASINYSFDIAIELAKIFKQLQDDASDKLDGMVYINGDLSHDNVYVSDNTLMIYGWENSRIGDKIDNLTDIIYNWCHLDEVFVNNDSKVIECIKKVIEEFGLLNQGLKLGDKILNYIDYKCKQLDKNTGNYAYWFKNNRSKRALVELYLDDINEM